MLPNISAVLAAIVLEEYAKALHKVASSVEDLIEYEVIDALVEQGHTKDEAYNMFYNGGCLDSTSLFSSVPSSLELT